MKTWSSTSHNANVKCWQLNCQQFCEMMIWRFLQYFKPTASSETLFWKVLTLGQKNVAPRGTYVKNPLQNLAQSFCRSSSSPSTLATSQCCPRSASCEGLWPSWSLEWRSAFKDNRAMTASKFSSLKVGEAAKPNGINITSIFSGSKPAAHACKGLLPCWSFTFTEVTSSPSKTRSFVWPLNAA